MRVVGHEPCFEVADVERAVSHYKLLGFTISYHDENYAFAHRDNLTIHLAHSEQPTTDASALYIHVDDADRLADDWRAAGVNVIGPTTTTTASARAHTETLTATCSVLDRRCGKGDAMQPVPNAATATALEMAAIRPERRGRAPSADLVSSRV